MNTENFVTELIGKTGLTQEQGVAAGDVFQSTFLAGNKDENMIVSQLSQKLGIDESQAKMVYDTAIGLLTSGALDKVKSIFK